jgi:hypothetical protein
MRVRQLSSGNSDRRVARRYPIRLRIKYSIVRRRRVLESGYGRTVNMSTGGLLIETHSRLPLGVGIQLFIDWPAAPRNGTALQLEVSGKTVRNDSNHTAISMTHREFLLRSVEEPERTLQRAAGD